MEKDTLTVLWTQDNKTTAAEMLGMYTRNALNNGWWKKITVVIWGASAELVGHDAEAQEFVRELLRSGVDVRACKACAEDLGVAEEIAALGVGVEYWGVGLTEALKTGTVLSV